MATAAINPASSIASAAQSLQLNDLLSVLVTELTHQDPFKPVDNKDFMAQIAQFAALDTTQQLNQNMAQLVALQALNQSVGLIGRTVSARLTDGTPIDGTVIALSLASGVPSLTIKTAAGTTFPNITLGQLGTVR
jgi:flagellar basal-body rod modification protein FlgD